MPAISSGRGCDKFHANRKQARLAVLRLGGVVSEFDLEGDHLAMDRVLREQRNHYVGLANLARDLSRPFFSDREMAIDEYVMAARAELSL
jgi:hypothetical protein